MIDSLPPMGVGGRGRGGGGRPAGKIKRILHWGGNHGISGAHSLAFWSPTILCALSQAERPSEIAVMAPSRVRCLKEDSRKIFNGNKKNCFDFFPRKTISYPVRQAKHASKT